MNQSVEKITRIEADVRVVVTTVSCEVSSEVRLTS